MLALAAPVAATADTKPASSSIPTTVSSDSLATAQLSGGVGWAQAVLGNTVYVGGNFSGARAAGASSSSTVSNRYNLMSYNLTTGALTSFAPNFNGQVLALAASPDGKTLYAGGAFTTVNGTARNRVAAIDTTTGTLTSWNPNASSTVNAVQATASTVFFGGNFTTVGGVSRTRAAAVSAVSGALTGFNPSITENSVKSMALSPDGSQVALGGFFSTIDGAGGSGFGIVDAATGRTLKNTPIRAAVNDGSVTSAIYGMSSDGTNVYGSGYYSQSDTTGNLEGTFAVNWNSGATVWINECHGDEYSSAALNGALYIAGHPHYCYDIPGGYPQTVPPGTTTPMYQRTIAVTTAATGTVKTNTLLQPRYYDRAGQPAPTMLDWFPTLAAGTFTGAYQASYNIIASGNYLLEVGEFPSVNGTTQYGVARFALPSTAPNADGPQVSGSTWPIYGSTLTAGTARISWLANYDRDNENLTYTLYRGSTAIYTTTAASRIWYQRPMLSYTDTGVDAGSSNTYKVTATDGWGNTKTSNTLTYTASATSASGYARQVVSDGATSYWRLGEASGTAIADTAGGLPATARGNVTLGAAGAIAGDANTAATFDGQTTTGIATNATANPTDTFSVESWFKSTSTTGGEIMGGGDFQKPTTTTFSFPGQPASSSTSDSNNHDRSIATTADGHVTFTVNPGAVDRVTSSSAGYNDGKWHHVVGTLSSAGQVLYVDGKQAGSANVNRALGVMEYWRIGGNAGYSTAPPTMPGGGTAVYNDFTGAIDEPAAYIGTALTAAQVANHYSLAGNAGAPTNSAPTASFTQTVSGLAVTTDAAGSRDSDGTIGSYSWNFGDSGTATGVKPTHTYTTAGTYTVTLTVTDNQGASATSSQSVAVSSQPPPATTIAKDAFGRTATSSLGTADTGGAYTLTGTTSRYSVNGSSGQLSTTAGSTKKALLASTSSSDTDVTASYALSALPVGGAEYLDLIGRSVGTSDDYRARVGVAANGAVTIQAARVDTSLKSATVSGLTYLAGDTLQVRVQVYGTGGATTIRARVWKVGSTEPTTWQVTATDTTAALQKAGSVGIGAYLSSAVTNGPIAMSVDNLLAAPTGN